MDVKTNLKVYLFREMKTVSRVVTQKEIMQFYSRQQIIIKASFCSFFCNVYRGKRYDNDSQLICHRLASMEYIKVYLTY